MATVIGDLFVRLGVDLDEMERGFASAESRLEKFGTRMFFMGSRISAGVGLPFAAASGAVIKWGMDFDKAMTESLAIMDNVTPAIRSEMAGVAKSISDFSKFSAEEGAQGFYHLASAGLDANAAMGALPIAAKFAQAGVMDLGKSTEFLAAAQAVMSTGAETSAEKVAQMARVADVLTLANNRALGTIQDFAEGLTGKAGAALRLYHKDIEEGVAVLAAYATQGTKGKEASTQLAMVLRDLAVQALKHADAFQKFNIQVYDAQGNFRNMAAVIHDVEVATDKMSVAQIRSMLLQLGIPQRSVDATQKLIGYSAAIRDHEAALRQAGGTTDKVANEQMKALSNQVVQLWNQFKNASIEIFDSFVPIISDHVVPLMKSALEQFKAFGNYIEGLPEPVKIFGLALGGAAIAAGPLIAFLGSLSLLGAAAMSLIGTVITPWTIAIAALAAAIIDIRVETGSWRDTLLALALPFGGTLTILEQLARWMGVNTQVIRDLGAIVRDVFIIGLEVAQDKMKDWGAMTMGVIGSVYEFAKDRLTWLVNMMTIGMPESMKAVVVGMVASLGVMAKNIPSAMDAVTKSIHQAREALDKIAGTTGPTGPSWLPAFFPGGPAPAKGAKPPGGGGMPGELPPDHTKRLTETEKMFSRLSGKDLQEDINATAAAFRQLVAAGKDIDPAIHERMWEAYKKLRVETTALVPEFGHLFKEEIKNHEEMAQMTAIAHGFGHTVEEAAAEAIHGLGGLHAAQMKVSYDSSASMTAIQDMVERSTAKLQDTETELHRFSESSGQAHRSTLKSNLSKIELDQNEHYRKMLRGLAMVDGEQYDEYVRYLGDLKRSDAEYLRYYEAVESGKYAASIGVNQRLLRKWEEFNQAQRDQIIATREQWLQFTRDIQTTIGVVGELGNLFTAVGGGMSEIGEALHFAAQNMDAFLKAGEEIQSGNMAKGIIMAGTATVNAIKTMMDTGSRMGRGAIGAETGFMLGGPIGALVGGIAGFLMKDPGWKKVQKSIDSMWDISVSKELATAIDKDSKNLGGRLNAMLAHLGDIIAAGGGLTANNVGQWASRLSQVFTSLSQGSLDTSQAAKILDGSFADLVKTGTQTNGLVSDQISRLVMLERQYKTGSAAIKEFVDAQLSMAASGFNKVAKGIFGPLVSGQEELDKLDQEQETILERITKLKAQIADYEKNGVKNEKQRVGLMLARVNLAKQERLMAESEAKERAMVAQVAAFMDDSEQASVHAQEQFDRMGRLASVTFQAMVANGSSYFDAIAAIGDGLDILIAAQKEFGLTSTDAFSQLMKFRDFMTVHPELVDALDGLQQMMKGLSNTSFMTEQTFNDLGDTAADIFQRMVDGGMTADEALMLMHPTLQLLWELQKKYGFAVDEATQKLLDQAEASGTVGEKYMSANDKMVAGIDKLNKMFELFLKHLGIDIPAEAEAAAKGVEDAFSGVNPQVDVDIHYRKHGEPGDDEGGSRGGDEAAMAEGGILTRPTHVLAGEEGPEAFIPLDRLFDEIQTMNAVSKDELHLTIMLDNDVLTEQVIKNVPRILKLRGM